MIDYMLILATLVAPILAVAVGVKFGFDQFLQERKEEKKLELMNFIILVIENIRGIEIKGGKTIEVTEDQIDTINNLYRRFRELCILYGIDDTQDFKELHNLLKKTFENKEEVDKRKRRGGVNNIIVFDKEHVIIEDLAELRRHLEKILGKLKAGNNKKYAIKVIRKILGKEIDKSDKSKGGGICMYAIHKKRNSEGGFSTGIPEYCPVRVVAKRVTGECEGGG